MDSNGPRRSKSVAILGMAIVALVVAPSSVGGATPPDKTASCEDERLIDASELPISMDLGPCHSKIIVVDHGIAAVVPERGMAVYVEGYGERETQELLIQHQDDGLVTAQLLGNESLSAMGPITQPTDPVAPECSDQSNNPYNWVESDDHTWFVNHASIPDYLDRVAVRRALIEGTDNIEMLRTDCDDPFMMDFGNSDSGIDHTYAGNTNLSPNITASPSCSGRDGINVIGFAAGGSFLAVACTWYYPISNEVIEGDVRFNTDYSWTVNPTSTGCLLRYDIEGVMTHERGHTFGLAHVDEASSPRMTMSTNIDGTCQAQERSLGFGDFLGISSKYGNG